MLSYIINLCLQPVSENLIMTQHNIPAEQWEKDAFHVVQSSIQGLRYGHV